MFDDEKQVDKRGGGGHGGRSGCIGVIGKRCDGGVEPSDNMIEEKEVCLLLALLKDVPHGVAKWRWPG